MPPRNINDILTPTTVDSQPAVVSLLTLQSAITVIKTTFNDIVSGDLYRDEVFSSFGLLSAFPEVTVRELLRRRFSAGFEPVQNPWVLGITAALGLDASNNLWLTVGSCDGVARFLFGQKRDLNDPANSDFLPIKKYPLLGQLPAGSSNSVTAIEYTDVLRNGFLESSATPLRYKGFDNIASKMPGNDSQSPVWFEIPLKDIYDMVYDTPANPFAESGEKARFQLVHKRDPDMPLGQQDYTIVMPHLLKNSGEPEGIVEGPTSPIFVYKGGI